MKIIRTSLDNSEKSEEMELTDELLMFICIWNGAGDKIVKGWLMAGKPVFTKYSIWRVITPNSLDYVAPVK